MSRIAIVGAGAWGTALAIHAARLGAGVHLVARRVGGPDRLPGFVLPASIEVGTAMPARADAVLLCVPMQHLRAALASPLPGAPLLVCCKGMEAGTGMLPLEVVAACRPGQAAAVLTGPNFAAGIAAGQPAAAVVAGADAALRERLIGLLAAPAFRLYGNADAMGAQLGGAAKNVIAIAAGVVMGAGHGENARAALVTRGLAELGRLIGALGGRPETASGLSGLGDLVLTCTGMGSRNFAYGLALGRGERGGCDGVVEGIATAPTLVARAAAVDLPICEAVAALLAGRVSVAGAMARVLARPLRDEHS